MSKLEFENFPEENESEIDQTIGLDLAQVRANVPQFSNEKLCDMIVTDRYLGLEHKVSSICMEELGKRRADGDTFEFETYIAKITKELPPLDFSLPNFQGLISKFSGKFKI